jgi:antitoxin (DNA-binding transcriptional repressor) of toxin-antitoxin stability system
MQHGQVTLRHMTIHVNIGEAKTRLSELVAAALRGEEVILQKAGAPVVTLVPNVEALAIEREVRAAKRKAAFGCLAEKYAGYPPEAFDVPPSMTDEELEERYTRKFG